MSTNHNAQKEDPGDFFWQTYLDASRAEDEARPKNWEGSTTGILTFTGLFAATVAAFIVESYKLLSPDSGERTNVLLEQILVAMANTSSRNPITVPPSEPFSPPALAVVTNAFWFSSLLIALVCALLSTLVQEWSRHYVQDINRREVLHESLRERAFNHIYIRMGVNRYGMDQFVSWIVALVHISVFLFACGLLVFLFPIHNVVAAISTGILGSFVAIYLVASVLPLLDRSCPYRTPVTYMMAFIYWLAWHSWKSRHDEPMTGLYYLTTRRCTGFHLNFLTPKRYWFASEHTVVHIHHRSSKDYFKALASIVNSGALDRARDVILNRLCADFDLLYRLHVYFAGSYFETRREPLSVEPGAFQLVALLFKQWFAMDAEHHSEPPRDTDYITSRFMSIIGYVSQMAQVDGPCQLSAHLCIAHVLMWLPKLCQKAFEKKIPALTAEEATGFGLKTLHLDIDRTPSAVLLLLLGGSFQGTYPQWEHTGASNLLPVHDDDCCKDWRGVLTSERLTHVAACTALTTIVRVLESSGDQRRHAETFLYSLPLRSIMPKDIKRKMPSSEFVSALRLAGLDEWLRPGSTFNTMPHDSPNNEFLTSELKYSPGRLCVGALREIAQHVDFAAYRARTAHWNNRPSAAALISPSHDPDISSSSQPSLPPTVLERQITHISTTSVVDAPEDERASQRRS